MNRATILVAVVAVALGLPFSCHSGQQQQEKATGKDVYLGLRNLAFQSSRQELGLPAPSKPTQPWGVIMEWGLAQGSATIVAFSDGHASVYLSSGGGFIGGAEAHEQIRNAAKRMVAIGAECQKLTHRTTVHPLPKSGEVKFYLLTDSGIFTAVASEEALSRHDHPLSKLGAGGQEVITQYRQAQ